MVDDNFLQPQPGTSASDHLTSGLVPVAILLGVLLSVAMFARGRGLLERPVTVARARFAQPLDSAA